MSATINMVILDLKKRLVNEIQDADWAAKRARQIEERIINLKNSIAELETLQHG